MKTRHALRHLLPPALLLLLSVTAGAQDYVERSDFQEDAGSLSLLYKGRLAPYLRLAANGNRFWNSPQFRKGSITFDGRTYDNVLVNFDAHRQIVLTTAHEGILTIALPTEKVEGFSIEDMKFVRIEGRKDIPDGFYREVAAGRHAFYMHVEKPLETSYTSVNGMFIGYEDPDYDPRLVDFYHYMPSYYFRNEAGNYIRIRTKGALLRQFPSQKKHLRRQMYNEGKMDRHTPLETFAAILLGYIER